MLGPEEVSGRPANDERRPVAAIVGRAFRVGSHIPLLVVALLIAVAAPVFAIQTQTANTMGAATLVEGILTNELTHFFEELERVAALQGASAPDSELSRSRATQLLLSEAHAESVLIADVEGNVVAYASRLADTVERPTNDEALEWIMSTSDVFVGLPQFDPILRRQAVVLAVPIDSPRGERRGMLQVALNTDFMVHAIDSTNQSLDGSSYVTTGTGQVIIHHDEWRILNRQQLDNVRNGLGVGLDGDLRIMGVVQTAAWGDAIHVVSTAPLSAVVPGAALGLVPLVLGIASFGVSRLARRRLVGAIVAPIHDLEAAVGPYGPGNLDVRAGASSVTEVHNVAMSFNRTADTIDALIESLTRSNEQLDEFASVAAHDLQEPMRKVRTFGDLLVTAPDSRLTDEQRGYIDRMQNAAARMQQLTDDLLVYSRVAHPTRAFQRVDLNETVAEVLLDLDHVIAEAAAEVVVDDLPVVEAEPLLMRQLMQNIISNSVKFRRTDTPARVHITSHSGSNGQATISVADNGIGFDPEYAERIFGIFERLHGRSDYPGTGIGLALCRKIVERHGGTMTAEGTEGKGATFTFTLPTHPGQLDRRFGFP